MYARYIPPPKAKSQSNSGPPPPPPAVVEVNETAPIAPTTSTITPYARYVPPPKSKRSEAPNPVAAPQKIVFNYDEGAEESSSKKRKLDVSEQDGAESGKKKPKKSKDKSRRKEDKDAELKEGKSLFGDLVDASEIDLEDDESGLPGQDSEAQEAGKKKKKSKKLDAAELDEEDDTSTRSKKEKKSKKSKVSDELVSPPDEEEDESQKTSKKKKKKRQDDAAADLATTSHAEDADEVTERHKAVLKKKEKSLKRQRKDATGKQGDEGQTSTEQNAPDVIMEEPGQIHGLEPLPQPKPVAQDISKLAYETLPSWLATPIRVTSSSRASFSKLGISAEVEKALSTKGYKEAFAVQTAVIPLLMPSADRQGDVVVSAATGSGKTLAYVLPMVRDISQGVVTRLRGLIVVPTRELVRQAQEVCEVCAAAFSGPGRKRVKIGIAMGNQTFKAEQAALMNEEQRYDPAGYQQYLCKRQETDAFEMFDSDPSLHDSTKPLPDHVIDHVSKVDILICTPGRLVEHINLTPGFSLDYVRWLVVDEADKLLAQSFQQWLDVVMEKLNTERFSARDFPDSNKSGVRKVILSATMTRDLSLLNGLKLRRPRLIVLEGTKSDETAEGEEDKTVHVLPELLHESAIKVRDPDLKPLLLVDLLQSDHLNPVTAGDVTVSEIDEQLSDADDTSSSGEDSDETSPSELDSDSSSQSSDDSDDDSPKAKNTRRPEKPFQTTVLIFTKSNETALRLSRLLSILSPNLSSLIGTLTSTTRTSQRRKTLRAFTNRKLRILIASDLVARGIDLTNLDHVVNYDMPTSVASYVHRVGRTARAGQAGHAWTFFTKTEAGWFWPEIAGQGKNPAKLGGIKRAQKVENIRFGGDEGGKFSEKRVEEYEAALEKLGQEAGELRRRR